MARKLHIIFEVDQHPISSEVLDKLVDDLVSIFVPDPPILTYDGWSLEGSPDSGRDDG